VGVKVGVANFFLGQSIGIDKNNTFQLKFYFSIKTVEATVLGGLWALEWAWHIAETNLRFQCPQLSYFWEYTRSS